MWSKNKSSADPSKTQVKLTHEQIKFKRSQEKAGRKANRGSHKGQKTATGRKSW